MTPRSFLTHCFALAWGAACASAAALPVLPGTAPLVGTNDLSDAYLSGLDRYMLAETEQLSREREAAWKRASDAGAESYAAWVATNRLHLARMLGVCDARTPFESPEWVSTLSRSALLGETATHFLYEIRWPVIGDFHAEGLLLEPKEKPVLRNVVYVPHAGVTPEQVLGLATEGRRAPAGFNVPDARCRMVVPAVVSRTKTRFESVFRNPGKGQLPGRMVMTRREYVYRPAYVMGRHIIGYEIQEILALVDWFKRENGSADIRVEGWGDGGLLALYAAALDTRIGSAVVLGYFGDRSRLWREPIDRNVFGLLREFGDAEVATLIAPRKLVVAAVPGPVEIITREKGEGGAPGELVAPAFADVAREAERARELAKPLAPSDWLVLSPAAEKRAADAPAAGVLGSGAARLPDAEARELRLVEGMNAFSQRLLAVSPDTRRAFMSRLDFASLEAYDRSAEAYRDYYREEIMGRIHAPKLPLNPRSRLVEETGAYACYEVVLDVLPDFMLYGYLLLPNEQKSGERRPVVVVQHGRGGTPRTVMSLDRGGRATYHEIAPRLAQKGYVVFAPQNPYVFEDRYRQLQRKANPLKLSLYSVIHAQYEQMFAWLKQLPQADAAKVAFIGQSYGGKTAVRVPPVMPGFCLAITTGDFNDGVTKMASTLYPFSFALWDEYEMFEFNLGNTFNYSDLAGLMAPRPFMVERGHADTVAWDEFVGYEYALVRKLYTQLKIPERTAIDWFDGGHEIDLEPALAFFDRFLLGR